jgi:hypothetical protein
MQAARGKLKSSGTKSLSRITNSMKSNVSLILRQATILCVMFQRANQGSDSKTLLQNTKEKLQGLIGPASIKNLIKPPYSALVIPVKI